MCFQVIIIDNVEMYDVTDISIQNIYAIGPESDGPYAINKC